MVTQLDKVDVVTVGVGWSGGIIAAELSKAGYQVVGLERGEKKGTEDYLNKHDELKYTHRHEMMKSLSKSTITFRNTMDETAAPLRKADSYREGTDTGGGGMHWAAQTHRYLPYDFQIRSQTIDRYGQDKIPEWMPLQDWGITYDELEPYYDKFEKTMGTSGEEDPLAAPRSDDYPNLPHPKTKSMRLFQKATENLGYHPYTMPSSIASEQYENPDGQTLNACQYNAFCNAYGCEWGAKASPITTVIPTAKETGNFELRTRANVKRVLYEGDRATGVLYEDTQTGEEFEQPADVVVVTSFTFNNVRLLLLSEIGQAYNPETGEGVIGKNYADHNPVSPHSTSIGFFDNNKFNLHIANGSLGMVFDDFNADHFDHSDHNFIHGGTIEMRQLSGNGPIAENNVPNGTPLWGREFKEKSLFYANRVLDLGTQTAVMPHQNNYLGLDPTYTDENGDPLLRVTFDLTENEHNLHNHLLDKCHEVLEEMGADIIEDKPLPENYTPGFSGMHSGGGVIMGDDPETSAVNNYMQMWEMDNLFVCGASAFPHFGPTNPTLTLGALTYRAAEGIEEYLNKGGGQLVEGKTKSKNV